MEISEQNESNKCFCIGMKAFEQTKKKKNDKKSQLLCADINHTHTYHLPTSTSHTSEYQVRIFPRNIAVNMQPNALWSCNLRRKGIAGKFIQTTNQLKRVIRCIWLVENWKPKTCNTSHTLRRYVGSESQHLPCCQQDYRHESHPHPSIAWPCMATSRN